MKGRHPLHSAEDDESPGLTDRLLAAVIAPIVFNFSIIVVLAVFFRRSRGLGRILYSDISLLGSVLFWGLLILPAMIGLLIGTARFATLLGHFFYTNMEHEKDARITVASWACLFLVAYLLSRAF
jgi:hypothetical protein